MPGISSLFNVGTRSMDAAKSGLNTSSHNIANSNTPGYSVQRLEVKTADPFDYGQARIGNGVQVVGVTRAHSEFLQKQMVDEAGKAGEYRKAAEAMGEIENVLNESITEKLNLSFSEFFNTFRDFSLDPDSESMRKTVLESSRALVRDVRSANTQLDGVRNAIDFRLKQGVVRVNELVKKVASLNETIALIQAKGLNPNDEMDQRDLAIRELAGLVDIKTSIDDKGFTSINMGGRLPLLIGASVTELDAIPTKADKPGEGSKVEGAFEVVAVTSGGSLKSVRSAVTGGELAGLVRARDEALVQVRDRLDSMVQTFVDNVNSIHKMGYGRDGFSGRELFSDYGQGGEVPLSHTGAMERFNLALSGNDTDALASAMQPGKSGDNRIALAIAALQHSRVFEGNATLQDYYSATVGQLGTMTRSMRSFDDHHSAILRQLNNYHESMVGVSMDEEAAKMVQLQHQFNASAKMIKAADEMLETVMSLKR